MNMHISLFFFPVSPGDGKVWDALRLVSCFTALLKKTVLIKKTNIQQLKPGSDVVGDETTLFSTEFN